MRALAVSAPVRVPTTQGRADLHRTRPTPTPSTPRSCGLVMPKDAPAEVVIYWEGVLRKVAEERSVAAKSTSIASTTCRDFLDLLKAFVEAIVETSNRYEAMMKELGIIK